MLRVTSFFIVLFLVTACAMPSEVQVPEVLDERYARPDHRERISHRLLWMAPEEKWHYNCLFLKPLARLTHDEQVLALPSADLLYRAHFEEKRMAYRSAGHLYRQVADHGVPLGYVKLGKLLLEGNGTKYNPRGGAELILQSARLDCAEGQHIYAELLTKGKGVATNLVEAWGWAELARKQGYPESKALQKKMESVMGYSQVALAKERARIIRSQLDLFNNGPDGKELVECTTPRNRKPFITRMRACHAMGGTHRGYPIKVGK